TRGAIMATRGLSGGAMLRIAAPAADVLRFIDGLRVAVACRNGPCEIVVSGEQAQVLRAEQRARGAGAATTRLAVSHAFHSEMMAPAVAAFTAELGGFTLAAPQRHVWSTVTGDALRAHDDVRALLARQIVAPVEFERALRGVATVTDILIEVGPGTGLTRLPRQARPT